MEHRAEPRFPVRSPIRVIVPGDPARILNGDLIDVSGTGMRFIADEQVTPDEIVAIEVDSRLVLAEIRYCQTRGYKFVVGVKRLQEVAKGAELKDSGACATEMIRDLRRHISAGGEGDLQALAMNALEKIVERSEISAAGDDVARAAARPAESRVISALPEPVDAPGNGTAIHATGTDGPAAGVTDVAQPDIASSPAHKGGDPAEIEFQEPRKAPTAEAPIHETAGHSSPMRELGASGPDDQEMPEILHEPARTVPQVLQAEVIEGDVEAHPSGRAQTDDVLEGDVEAHPSGRAQTDDVLEGDVEAHPSGRAQTDTDKPVAVGAKATFQPHPSGREKDVPAESVSAGEAAGIAEVEPAANERVVNVETVPIAFHAPASPGAAQEADPLSARRAEMGAAYLAADSAGSPARRSRSWRVPVAIAAALILACAIVVFLIQRRSQASSLAPPIETHATEVAPSPAPASPDAPAAPAALPASIPSPDPTRAKKAGVHHVEIRVADPSWIGVVADGGKLFQTVLHNGDVHEFDYSKNAVLRLGHAAGTVITLDGAPVGPLKGTVLLLQFTPQGVKYQ